MTRSLSTSNVVLPLQEHQQIEVRLGELFMDPHADPVEVMQLFHCIVSHCQSHHIPLHSHTVHTYMAPNPDAVVLMLKLFESRQIGGAGFFLPLSIVYYLTQLDSQQRAGQISQQQMVDKEYLAVQAFDLLWDNGLDLQLHQPQLTFKWFNRIRRCPQVLQSFLAHGLDPSARDDKGDTLLMASIYSPFEVQKVLMDCGTNVSLKNKMGRNALMRAATHGKIDFLNALMAKGARLNVQDVRGWTALHYAAHNAQYESMNQLLVKGARVDLLTHSAQSVLHMVCKNSDLAANTKQQRYLEMIREVIMAGALVNLKDKVGNTPLHYLASQQQPEIIKHLIGLGANTLARNKKGETPQMMAKKRGLSETAQFLAQMEQVQIEQRELSKIGRAVLPVSGGQSQPKRKGL